MGMIGIAAMLLGIGDTDPGPPARSRLTWDGPPITVFAPRTGGAWYPRLLRLRDGDLLCAYDTDEGASRTHVQISRSGDGGRTWEVLGRASSGMGHAANGQMVQLPDGAVLCAYRLVDGDAKSLRVARSGDGGRTWEHLSTVVSEPRGVWEPHMIPGAAGDLLLFHATEAHPPQAIALRRSGDGGRSWGPEQVVAAHSRSRDGMPVVTRTPEGALVLVFEAQDVGMHPFVVRSITSTDDGRTWGPRRLVYEPAGPTKRASAPYVTTLPTGELLASFQTDEDRAGHGDGSCDMKTVRSADGGRTWGQPSAPFALDRGTATWNALFVLDARTVAAASSVHRGREHAIQVRLGRLDPE